jgi:hypothetical protein
LTRKIGSLMDSRHSRRNGVSFGGSPLGHRPLQHRRPQQ